MTHTAFIRILKIAGMAEQIPMPADDPAEPAI